MSGIIKSWQNVVSAMEELLPSVDCPLLATRSCLFSAFAASLGMKADQGV
jgi:hypothetical protein